LGAVISSGTRIAFVGMRTPYLQPVLDYRLSQIYWPLVMAMHTFTKLHRCSGSSWPLALSFGLHCTESELKQSRYVKQRSRWRSRWPLTACQESHSLRASQPNARIALETFVSLLRSKTRLVTSLFQWVKRLRCNIGRPK
jgi:hypothetical protein